jgi:hypothetical protein
VEIQKRDGPRRDADIWRNLFTAWALQSGVDAKPKGLALECMAYGTNFIYAHEEIEDDPTTLARHFLITISPSTL